MNKTTAPALPRQGLQGRKGARRTAKGTSPRIEAVGILRKDRRPPDVALRVHVSIRTLRSGASRMLRLRRGRGRGRRAGRHRRRRLLRKIDIRKARASRREGHRQKEGAETTRTTTQCRQRHWRGEGHGRRGQRRTSRPARLSNGRMQAARADVLHPSDGAHMARLGKRHILDGNVRRTDNGAIRTPHAEVEVAVQGGRHASIRQHMAEDRVELHRGVDAGLRGEAVETNIRSTEGRVGSRQRHRRRRRDHRRRRQGTSPPGEREDDAMEALRMPGSVPSRNTDLPRNPPPRRAPRHLDDVGMTIIVWSRQPVGTAQSGTAHIRHRWIPKRQVPRRLLRRAEGEVRGSDSRHTVVDRDEPSTDGHCEGLHLGIAPQQRAERILQEKGEPGSFAAQPVERGKELAPEQVRQATLTGTGHESPGDTVRVRVTTTAGRVGGAWQAALELHHVGGKSATNRRQEGLHQVRRRHAHDRHLHVQEPGQVRRRQRDIGKSNRPRVDVDSQNHRAGGLPKPAARIRQVLRPTAVGDEDDRRVIPPHIRCGRGNERRRPDARAAAGCHGSHTRARGTPLTESRTRHGIVGARHGKRRARTRAQRGESENTKGCWALNPRHLAS